jgi:hypothetical protein
MEYYAKFDEATLQHLSDIMKSGLCTEPITLTQNGTYVAPVGKGYTPVTVDVKASGLNLKKFTPSVVIYTAEENVCMVYEGYNDIKFFANTNTDEILTTVELSQGRGVGEIYGNQVAYIGPYVSMDFLTNADLEYYTGVEATDVKYDREKECYYIDKDDAVIAILVHTHLE